MAGAANEGTESADKDAVRLLLVVLALVSLGMLMVWSTTVLEAERPKSATFGDPTFFLRRQVLWTMLAAISLAIAWSTDYRLLLRWRFHLVGVTALALVAVL